MKEYLAIRVYNIAEKYNLSHNIVHDIIKEYARINKDLLYSGRRIDFNGLAYIEPDVISSRHRITTGFICKKIANIMNLPYYTVLTIIREYLKSLKVSLLEGKTAEIRGIITIHPVKTEDNRYTIHSAISIVIRDQLRNANDFIINSVRVHTYKSLKKNMEEIEL